MCSGRACQVSPTTTRSQEQPPNHMAQPTEPVEVSVEEGSTLLPPVNKHEHIIRTHTQHQENGQHVQLRVELDSKNDAVCVATAQETVKGSYRGREAHRTNTPMQARSLDAQMKNATGRLIIIWAMAARHQHTREGEEGGNEQHLQSGVPKPRTRPSHVHNTHTHAPVAVSQSDVVWYQM